MNLVELFSALPSTYPLGHVRSTEAHLFYSKANKHKSVSMKVFLGFFIAVVTCVNVAIAQPLASRDSAKRYAESMPIEDVIDEMLVYYVRNAPVQARQGMANEIKKRLNKNTLLETYIDILIKVYSTEELEALANFYSTPIGASAHSKRYQVIDKYWMFQGEVERAVKQTTTDLQSNEKK